MDFRKDTDAEIEAFRLERLAEAAGADGDSVAELAERFIDGDLGAHEALHTASLVMDFHDRHLASHPYVLLDPELYRLAHKAGELLFEVYQRIGARHLGKA